MYWHAACAVWTGWRRQRWPHMDTGVKLWWPRQPLAVCLTDCLTIPSTAEVLALTSNVGIIMYYPEYCAYSELTSLVNSTLLHTKRMEDVCETTDKGVSLMLQTAADLFHHDIIRWVAFYSYNPPVGATSLIKRARLAKTTMINAKKAKPYWDTIVCILRKELLTYDFM